MRRFVLLFIAAITLSPAADRGPPNSAAELFQSPENLKIVSAPSRVEVCMLYPRPVAESDSASERKYDESAFISPVSKVANQLSAILTSDASFPWGDVATKACMPLWNARLKFIKGEDCVTADLCFGCNTLLLSRDGVAFAQWDFDPSSSMLFEVVRSLFPKDRVIRQIEEREVERAKNREAIRKAIEQNKNSTGKKSP